MPDLTKPQLDELKRLVGEPRSTYGRGRARVQHTLVELGLAQFHDGFVCVITEEGRNHLIRVSL